MDTTPIDFYARAKERLSLQYKGKPGWEIVLRIIARQCEELEAALLQLYTLRSIDASEGKQLDNLGTVVGLERNAMTDEQYRAHLRARIRANRSNTSIRDVRAVFAAALPTATVTITEYRPASFSLALEEVTTTEALANIYRALLTLAKAGGVATRLHWQPAEDAESFTFDGGPGLGFHDEAEGIEGGAWSGAL